MTWAGLTAHVRAWCTHPVPGQPKTIYFDWLEACCCNGQALIIAATMFNDPETGYAPHFMHFSFEDDQEPYEFVMQINV
jgi:hypothetical protein